jgi:GntR family transcriptional regulator
LTGFFQDMADRGTPPTSRVLKQQLVPAASRVAGFLQLEPGTPIIEIERLRFVRKEPMVLVTTFLPHTRCAAVLHTDLTRQSLYGFMEKQCGIVITRGHRTMEAVAASQREAELLQISVGAPLMLLDSVSYIEDGTPIEYYHALHRGDRSRFEAELIRVPESARS